jgi:hypothetical protein
LISRNGNTFRGFGDLASWIAEHLRAESAVLDCEIDDAGGRDTVFKLKKNGDGNSSKRPAAVSESENHRGEFCANSLAGQTAREQKVGKFMAELLH